MTRAKPTNAPDTGLNTDIKIDVPLLFLRPRHTTIYTTAKSFKTEHKLCFPASPPPPPPTKYAYPLCTSSLISIPTWWRVWLRFLFYLVYNTPGHHAKNTPCMLDVSCSQLAFSKVKTNLGLDQANSCFTAAAPISKDVSIFLLQLDHTT